MSALTTTRMPSHLEMARRGRRARNVRIDRNEVTPEALAPMPTQLMQTIMKSRTVQKDVKYSQRPKPTHFIPISMVKRTAKISSKQSRIS